MGLTVSRFGEPARHLELVGDEFVRVEPERRTSGRATIDVAERCPTPSPYNGANCRRRACPHCGRGWVSQWEAKMRLDLGDFVGEVRAGAGFEGRVMLVSITAPGASRLPWSCAKRHNHGGPKGCRVKRDYADVWAAGAPAQLAKLRDAARLNVKRAGLQVDHLWLYRVWEPQSRGVPHVHVVVGARTPAERAAADRFVGELRRLAPEYGFGHQLHVTKPMEGREAARYLAGYLLGRSKRKNTIRENLGDPRMPRSLIYAARKLGQASGVTIRRLRVARWLLAAEKGAAPVFPNVYGAELVAVAHLAARLERGNAPPEDRFRVHFRALIRNGAPRLTPLGADIAWRCAA